MVQAPTASTKSSISHSHNLEPSASAHIDCKYSEPVPVFSAPGTSEIFTVNCGDKVTLLDPSGNQSWLQIRTTDGHVGYISFAVVTRDHANLSEVTPTTVSQVPTPHSDRTVAAQGDIATTITFVTVWNGSVVHLMPDWAIKWVNGNAKKYPHVRFQTSGGPVVGARNFVIAFSSSSAQVQGFEPVVHTDTSTSYSSSTGPMSGSGTITDNEGETWRYTYDGTVTYDTTTTTTTTRMEQAPFTRTSNAIYVTAFDQRGQVVAQRWHVYSTQSGGSTGSALGYNLGNALGAIHARSHLMKDIVKDVVGR
jgi:Bacterial SH3 domain